MFFVSKLFIDIESLILRIHDSLLKNRPEKLNARIFLSWFSLLTFSHKSIGSHVLVLCDSLLNRNPICFVFLSWSPIAVGGRKSVEIFRSRRVSEKSKVTPSFEIDTIFSALPCVSVNECVRCSKKRGNEGATS